MIAKVYFDGSYDWGRSNATGGCVIELGKQRITDTWDFGTQSMQACEFLALAYAIRLAKRHGATRLVIIGDSQLVVNITKGRWKARKSHIKIYLKQVTDALASTPYEIMWMPRTHNKADKFSRMPVTTNATVDVMRETC